MYLLICFVYLFILYIFPHADTNPRHSNQKLINAFLQQKAGVEIWPVVIGGSLPNIGENIVSMPFFMARSVGLTVSELPGTLNSSLRQALSHTDGTAHRLMFSHNAPLHSAYLVYFIACFDSVAESVLKLSNVNLWEIIVWAHQLETIQDLESLIWQYCKCLEHFTENDIASVTFTMQTPPYNAVNMWVVMRDDDECVFLPKKYQKVLLPKK